VAQLLTKSAPALTPPRPVAALRVGIVGHRTDQLSAHHISALEQVLPDLLAQISKAATRVLADPHVGAFYQGWQPDGICAEFALVTPLAQGTDQLAASAALAAGYRLAVIHPFDADAYKNSFGPADDPEVVGARQHYDALASLPQSRVQLLSLDAIPASTAYHNRGFEAAGALALRQTDLLIAVWNGKPVRGVGGTADVISAAVACGIPVIWVPVEELGAAPLGRLKRIVPGLYLRPMQGLDPVEQAEPIGSLDDMIAALFAPPGDPLADNNHTPKKSILSWLITRVTGVAPEQLHSGARERLGIYFSESSNASAAQTSLQGPPELNDAYAWADGLAVAAAVHYRRAYNRIFRIAGFAICCAAIGFAMFMLAAVGDARHGMSFPYSTVKKILLALEVVSIIVLILYYSIARARRWHEKSIDYRYLAEALRHQALLFRLACHRGDTMDRGAIPTPTSWTQWLVRAHVRSIGIPTGKMDAVRLRDICKKALESVDGQIAYHTQKIHREHHINHRLHRASNSLFLITAILCALMFLVTLIFPSGAKTADVWSAPQDYFNLSAGVLAIIFPTIAASIYGMRHHADHEGQVHRSQVIVHRLQEFRQRLATGDGNAALDQDLQMFTTVVPLICGLCDDMLAEVDQWHSVLRTKPVAIPG
jgi:hypothetical protein